MDLGVVLVLRQPVCSCVQKRKRGDKKKGGGGGRTTDVGKEKNQLEEKKTFHAVGTTAKEGYFDSHGSMWRPCPRSRRWYLSSYKFSVFVKRHE